MSPRVSVIIPNYNHGAYLRQRIESVLHQTYQNIEVIILDDCSSDNSQHVIHEYKGHPLITKIVFNAKNSGSAFKQWKLGVEMARGEWIWIAESDDYADTQYLETALNAVENRSNIGLVYCDSNIVTNSIVSEETFASIKNKKFKTSRWSDSHINSGLDEIENYLLLGGTINNTSAVLFRRDIFLTSQPFDRDMRYIGDKYAFVKVLAKSDVAYIKEKLNYFRNPFNTKHADRFVFYFYEQFLLFDWVLKNLAHIDRSKFFFAFQINTNNSLFRDWNKTKLSLYIKLFRLNSRLLLRSVTYNFFAAITSLIRRFDSNVKLLRND